MRSSDQGRESAIRSPVDLTGDGYEASSQEDRMNAAQLDVLADESALAYKAWTDAVTRHGVGPGKAQGGSPAKVSDRGR